MISWPAAGDGLETLDDVKQAWENSLGALRRGRPQAARAAGWHRAGREAAAGGRQGRRAGTDRYGGARQRRPACRRPGQAWWPRRSRNRGCIGRARHVPRRLPPERPARRSRRRHAAFRRSARPGGAADRGGDITVESRNRSDRGYRQKAEEQWQHQRQQSRVDGHAAAPSQQCEQAPVHGAN
jgi:hypothetical protein